VKIRVVHRTGEVREVDLVVTDKHTELDFGLGGNYHVALSGQIAGLPSWRVHPDDMRLLPKPLPTKSTTRLIAHLRTVKTGGHGPGS